MIIFESLLTTLGAVAVLFDVAGAEVKIGSKLRPKHHNQVKLVQIADTHCSSGRSSLQR